jgi:hypothetical protein
MPALANVGSDFELCGGPLMGIVQSKKKKPKVCNIKPTLG